MRTDFTLSILDLCTEDWYGLWEIYAHVAAKVAAPPDPAWAVDIPADTASAASSESNLPG
jgi:hypothetical protein